ncbi:histidine phosphatase family protein [Actinotalea sp. Marseille-Q4924]|uniref:SixA phosphatase family protein n=1 Tax=Actinotalea sp. Marseille-Q4924 TaxID=2866571 RepID=UPI001CE3FA5B|nr:histidine phosphatase family protein [Actinotalea sp. Marseille-Q4924]
MGDAVARRLVLLRHAKAEVSAALRDDMRPLALRGRRQCGDVAAHLTAAGLLPDVVLVSSALRTRQTWELVRAGLGDVAARVEVTDRLYLAGVAELLDVLREVDEDARTVLVVGHEPTVSAAAARLAGEGEAEHLAQVRAGLPTASSAVLETHAVWAALDAGDARLVDVVRARH